MPSSRFSFLAGLAAAAGLVALCACKRDDPAPPSAQAATGLAQPATPPGRTPVVPEFNPARNVPGQISKPYRTGLAKMRPFAAMRSTKIGKGTLSLTLEGLGPQTMAMSVYRRGRLIILSADRPDLGIVLALPTLAAGKYVRGSGPGTTLRPPNLRARIGPAHQAQHLQAADPDLAAALVVEIAAGSGGAASGKFEAQVSRDRGQMKRRVTEGRFELQVDNAIPGVAEVFSLAFASQPPAPPSGATGVLVASPPSTPPPPEPVK